MTPGTERTLRTIRPFVGHGRAILIESAVDEAERSSGLIVPFGGEVKRGVVESIAYAPEYDQAWRSDRDEPPDDWPARLERGASVYYRNGVRIADVVVVELTDIVAYEAE